MAVRQPALSDVATLAALNERAWRAAYGTFVSEATMAPVLARLPQIWEENVAATGGQETWITEDDDGWVTVGPSRDADTPPHEGELWALYVDPDLVGAGVGHGLHALGLTRLRARGFASASLWTFAQNARAVAFYERHGWARDARPFDPGRWDWAPCVRMVRTLGP